MLEETEFDKHTPIELIENMSVELVNQVVDIGKNSMEININCKYSR